MKIGEVRRHTFKIKNCSNAPLAIEFATGSCTCTEVEDYPRLPIPPGGTAEIKVKYTGLEENLGEDRVTSADIIANTEPIVTSLKIHATVVK